MKNLKHELVNRDAVFVGTALEVVLQLRNQAYFERGLPVDTYLTSLARSLSATSDSTIVLPDGDVEDRAESFIQELIRLGIFKEA